MDFNLLPKGLRLSAEAFFCKDLAAPAQLTSKQAWPLAQGWDIASEGIVDALDCESCVRGFDAGLDLELEVQGVKNGMKFRRVCGREALSMDAILEEAGEATLIRAETQLSIRP